MNATKTNTKVTESRVLLPTAEGWEVTIKGVKITLEQVSVDGEQHFALRADGRIVDGTTGPDLANMLAYHNLTLKD